VVEIPESAGTGQLKFTAEVDVRPTIDLPELSTLAIEVEPIEITDADVDERMDAHRERFSTLVGVDRPAKDGDFVTIDLRAVIGDEEIDAVNGISYQIGDGSLIDGLDEALTGLSADETTTFESNLAGGDHAGEAATVTVTATAVKERELPAADDDFAQMASEFDTIGELREDLRTEVGKIKRGSQAVAARGMLVDKLIDAVEVPLPERIITEAVDRHLASEGKDKDDDHRAEAEEEERKGLTSELILDALAEKLDVKVGQAELADFLVHTSQQYGMDPPEFIANLDRTGRIPAMVADLARNKAVAAALRQVPVKDTSGAAVDLTEFLGSDEADDAQRALDQAAQEALAAE
jgi:trigger factor